jgi:hypothetical protein
MPEFRLSIRAQSSPNVGARGVMIRVPFWGNNSAAAPVRCRAEDWVRSRWDKTMRGRGGQVPPMTFPRRHRIHNRLR